MTVVDYVYFHFWIEILQIGGWLNSAFELIILALSVGFEILTPSLACRVRGSLDLLSILNSNLTCFLDKGWSNSACFNKGLKGFLLIACLTCSMHLVTAGRPVSPSYRELLPSSLHNLQSIMYPTPVVVQGYLG